MLTVHAPARVALRCAVAVVIALAALLGDAHPAHAQTDEEPAADGSSSNEGFYARLFIAAAARADGASFTPPMSTEPIEANGGTIAADVEVGAGFAPIAGLNIGASLLMLLGQTTLTTTCPASVTEPCPSPTVGITSGLTLFIDWYPAARGGFHLGGGLGIVRTTLRTQSTVLPDHNAHGGLLHLAAGYDFWLTNDFALGLFVRILGYRAEDDGVITSGGTVSLGVTLVYQ